MKNILVTGGCGFIGTNCSIFFLKKNYNVFSIDNLSREGSKKNLIELKNFKNFFFFKKDTRDNNFINNLIKKKKFDLIIHLAGQVAVTKSILNPIYDFETNLTSTLNILEAIRKHSKETTLIFSSTNKVYGSLPQLKLVKTKTRYIPKIKKFKGICEKTNLDFHSPYGCSKGSADQYVIDYGRIYKLKTFVLRQSCIYGEYQTGIEDQGWIAWIMKQTLKKKRINIFGNGRQVRDALHISDLINLYYLIYKKSKKIKSDYFNIGGGSNNSISILELINKIKKLKLNPIFRYQMKRKGDQEYFVSDNSKIKKIINWEPKIRINQGIEILYKWLSKKQS